MLVSHHMFLVQTLCTRAICMSHGTVLFDGDPLSAIVSYRKSLDEAAPGRSAAHSKSGGYIHIFQLEPLGEWFSETEPYSDSGMKLTFVAEAEPNSLVGFRLAVSSMGGFSYYSFYSDPVPVPPSGRITCELQIPELMLLPGHYSIFGGLLKANELNHLLAEEHLQIFVRARGPAPAFDNGTGGTDNLFWNRGVWRISGVVENDRQVPVQDERNCV